MGQHDAVEWDCAKAFRALEVAFLCGREQWVEHLDRCFEHFDEFQQALIGQAQTAGKTVGVRVVLSKGFELANVDLANQRRDVLVVFVAGLGLRDSDLFEDRRIPPDDFEFANIATKLFQSFDCPWRQDALQIPARDAVFLFQDRPVFRGVEKSKG